MSIIEQIDLTNSGDEDEISTSKLPNQPPKNNEIEFVSVPEISETSFQLTPQCTLKTNPLANFAVIHVGAGEFDPYNMRSYDNLVKSFPILSKYQRIYVIVNNARSVNCTGAQNKTANLGINSVPKPQICSGTPPISSILSSSNTPLPTSSVPHINVPTTTSKQTFLFQNLNCKKRIPITSILSASNTPLPTSSVPHIINDPISISKPTFPFQTLNRKKRTRPRPSILPSSNTFLPTSSVPHIVNDQTSTSKQTFLFQTLKRKKRTPIPSILSSSNTPLPTSSVPHIINDPTSISKQTFPFQILNCKKRTPPIPSSNTPLATSSVPHIVNDQPSTSKQTFLFQTRNCKKRNHDQISFIGFTEQSRQTADRLYKHHASITNALELKLYGEPKPKPKTKQCYVVLSLAEVDKYRRSQTVYENVKQLIYHSTILSYKTLLRISLYSPHFIIENNFESSLKMIDSVIFRRKLFFVNKDDEITAMYMHCFPKFRIALEIKRIKIVPYVMYVKYLEQVLGIKEEVHNKVETEDSVDPSIEKKERFVSQIAALQKEQLVRMRAPKIWLEHNYYKNIA